MQRSIIAALALAGALAVPAAGRADPVKIRVGWVAAPGELPSIMEFKKDVAKHWASRTASRRSTSRARRR